MNQLSRKSILVLMGLALAACAAPPPRAAQTSAGSAATAAPASGQLTTLNVLAHDSFSISEDVLKQFEADNNAKVNVLKSGDAASVLNKAILSKGAPIADVLYGVDNTFLSRALGADIFEPYAAPALAKLQQAILPYVNAPPPRPTMPPRCAGSGSGWAGPIAATRPAGARFRTRRGARSAVARFAGLR